MKNNQDNLPEPGKGAPYAQTETEEKGFMGWVKRNKLITFLLLLIILGGLFFLIRMNMMERDAAREKAALESHYEMQLDSLDTWGMERSARIFSWAVRSEMTRQNMEQVNQFFSNLIRDPRIAKIKLIHPADGRVILSTDQKDHGEIITEEQVVGAETTFSIPGEQTTRIITPVMGLDARIGVLQITVLHRDEL